MKCQAISALVVLALIYPMSGSCSAPLEREAAYLKKRYNNGDEVSLECDLKHKGKCELTVALDKRKRKIKVDFRQVGLEPQLNSIQLFVQSRERFEFAVNVGVRCRAVDEALLTGKPVAAADCYAEFVVSDGQIEWNTIHISPISDINVYNDIQTP